ncbi:PCC domain-containing protein [Caldisericum exile]|uniref:PPC domain-containing protein n=1 Tax=Caldisericum exile (strain DSM 21853 / NBRC 104410 / AZM16c01) TaxID=511051 RepID=A0A7U6JEC2_CALEA|nr:DUF296 domain-containing protein [Caldisericum exile]BAL80298.1 hypothetical protein CSE_01720 [Caldisericum exile AZM16c01]
MKIKKEGSFEFIEMERGETLNKNLNELIGLSGFIVKDNSLPLHLHVYLGNSQKGVIDGHLFDSEVFTFGEMSILWSPINVKRILKDGLFLLDF